MPDGGVKVPVWLRKKGALVNFLAAAHKQVSSSVVVAETSRVPIMRPSFSTDTRSHGGV